MRHTYIVASANTAAPFHIESPVEWAPLCRFKSGGTFGCEANRAVRLRNALNFGRVPRRGCMLVALADIAAFLEANVHT